MLEFERQQAKLSSFNSRGEHHGQEIESAADLKFEANCSADILADLHPTLRHFLFCKSEAAAGTADLADQAHEAPNLRMPKLKFPIEWELETIGQELTIHYGMGGKSDIVIQSCRVNKITVTPMEGGTVILTFRVQGHPDEKQAGKLHKLVQHSCEISLIPPSFPPASDLATPAPATAAA